MKKPSLEEIKKLFENPGRVRILAFGSSNTERYLYGMHWFDIVNLGIREKYGSGKTHFINTGIGGHTTADLLARFQDDAAFYKPHMVFITVGGNDSNPAKNFTEQQFRNNLIELHNKFSAIGTLVIFQTYYSPNPEELDKTHLANFHTYMDTVRAVAASTNSGIVDHLKRWEILRTNDNASYLKMMLNTFHVNETGNILLGLDILKSLDLEIPVPMQGNETEVFKKALKNQIFIDKLN